jgi:hypothetical protein
LKSHIWNRWDKWDNHFSPYTRVRARARVCARICQKTLSHLSHLFHLFNSNRLRLGQMGQMGQPVTPPKRGSQNMVSAHGSRIQANRIAIDIERLLIWTYRDQRADVVLGRGYGLHDQEAMMDGIGHPRGSDSLVALARIGLLGTRVDGGGPTCDALHADAEITHNVVLALDRPIGLLVMQHARDASRPDQITIAPSKPVAATDARGRNVHGYDAWDKNRDYGWCKLLWTMPLDGADIARVEYGLWHAALRRIAKALDKDRQLTEFRATPPRAPAVSVNLSV